MDLVTHTDLQPVGYDSQRMVTAEDSRQLHQALSRYCTCEHGMMGHLLRLCATHRAVREDDRFVGRLLFARWMRLRWTLGEFSIAPDPYSGIADRYNATRSGG